MLPFWTVKTVILTLWLSLTGLGIVSRGLGFRSGRVSYCFDGQPLLLRQETISYILPFQCKPKYLYKKISVLGKIDIFLIHRWKWSKLEFGFFSESLRFSKFSNFVTLSLFSVLGYGVNVQFRQDFYSEYLLFFHF